DLVKIGKQGLDQYGHLVGLNGVTDMNKTLKNLPGYQFALNQSIEAAKRGAAGQGNLQSGNYLTDLQNRGEGLASQNYFNYLNALNPYFGLSQNAAAGQLGVANGQGAVAGQQANVATGLGSQLAGIATNQGTQLANIATGTANNIGNLYTNQGQNIHDYYAGLSNYKQQQAANDAAMWGNILQLCGTLGGALIGAI